MPTAYGAIASVGDPGRGATAVNAQWTLPLGYICPYPIKPLGTLSGQVTQSGTPLPYCTVRCYFRNSGQLYRATKTDVNGNFVFIELNAADVQNYYLIAIDYNGGYNLVGLDRLTPLGPGNAFLTPANAALALAGLAPTPVITIGSTLLMHFDGANNSTTFTDEKGHAFSTGVGSPIISTADYEFGGSSLYLNGSSTISTSASNDFKLSGDFTIDCWANAASNPGAGNYSVVGSWGAARTWLLLLGSSNVGFGWNGSYLSFNWTFPTPGTRFHLAVVNSGGTLTVYLNGTSLGSQTLSGAAGSIVGPLTIGRNDDSGGVWYFNGYIDELRIIKVAEWTLNFTPPTSAYTL
jgi:hypothetical protein